MRSASLLTLLPMILLSSAALAEDDTSGALDQLLGNVGPLLEASEAYHSAEEPLDAPETLVLDLARCVDLAIAQNAQVLVADTEVALRESQTGQAQARRRPEVKAQWAYTYVDGLDQEIGRPVVQRLIGVDGYAPDKGTITTGLTVTQILYAGGQIDAAIKASQFLAASESWRAEAVRAEIAYQARTAYHDALLAHAIVHVATEALTVFERHLADTEALESEGVVTPFEVRRAQTEVGARRADLASAEAAAQLADLNIRRLLALPDKQPLEYERDLPHAVPDQDGAALKAAALAQRPELRALSNALAAGHQQARAVKGKYLPQAAASLSWINVENGGQVLPDGWQINVGAQWDLYLGGQRKHEQGEVRARISGLKLQHADLERLVALDVEQALIRLHEGTVAMKTGQENVALAAESVRLAKLRYQEGFGTQTEIIDSALVHTQAKTALVQAIHDYYVAYASLQKALGSDRVPAGE